MTICVRKWGNSLAVRIPRALAEETSLTDGAYVDAQVKDGSIVLSRTTIPKYDLATLVAGITDENRHEAADWGPAVGKEVW